MSCDLSSSAVLRFAPSPNGRLHLGHAYSALLNQKIARALDGVMLLRIEDIDRLRCPPELVEACRADLAWLGLTWPESVRQQSAHFADYQAGAATLHTKNLLYPCQCSRTDISRAVQKLEAEAGKPWPRDPDGVALYPGTCRGRSVGSGAAAWRLDMAAACAHVSKPLHYMAFAVDNDGRIGDLEQVIVHPPRWGDAVLVRKDTPTSYHLSVVMDDALQQVSHVVRGRDLLAATDLHVLLQTLLGLPTPLYHHHDLLRDEHGGKLAKSQGSKALAELRAEGWSPEAVRTHLDF